MTSVQMLDWDNQPPILPRMKKPATRGGLGYVVGEPR
jgi:hypothetical protein